MTRAKRRGFQLNVTANDAYALLVAQNWKCALSGLPIRLPMHGTDYLEGNTTASLDRIDSKKGYIVGNVQWVHKHVNLMKNTLDESYFKDLCTRIAHLAQTKEETATRALLK